MRSARLFSILLVVLLMDGSLGSVFAAEIRTVAAEKRMEADADLIEAARRDVNAFIEYCFDLKQAPIHIRLQAHWDEFDRTVDLFPIEHGKTTQTTGRILFELGEDPSRCIAFISNGAEAIEATMGAVKRAILFNPKVRAVFPDLVPETHPNSSVYTCWQQLKIRVGGAPKNSLRRDYSLAAYIVGSGRISGSRLDRIYIDNACDSTNTLTPHVRKKTTSNIDNNILSRLLKDGRCRITDTSWYDDDPPHAIGKRKRWDMQIVDAEKGENGQPVWPEQWSWQRLRDKLEEITQIPYDRTLRNITTSASMGIFKEDAIDKCIGGVEWYDQIRWPEHRPEPIRVITGVDLGIGQTVRHDKTVFFTAVRVGHQYQLLNMASMRVDGVDILRNLIAIYRNFHAGADSSEIKVESNQAQEYIVHMCQDAAIMEALGADLEVMQNLYVTPFKTTAYNKRDIDFGVHSVASDLEMGRWKLPVHNEVAALKAEMLSWSPDAHTGDHLMSMWICREGLRLATNETAMLTGESEAAKLWSV